MNGLVAVMLAAAVLLGAGSVGRPGARIGPLSRTGWPGVGGGSGNPQVGRGPRGGTVSRGWSGPVAPRGARLERRARHGRPDLAALVGGVAAQLRAGADVPTAWTRALGVPVGAAGPDLAAVLGTAGGRARAQGRARAVLAATRVATELGTPLAPVLDVVATALAADADADAELRVALAGPRSTARVVGWLPVLGLLLGLLLGGDPVGVLLGGGAGTATGVLGAVLLVAGKLWTRTLVDRASETGTGRRRGPS